MKMSVLGVAAGMSLLALAATGSAQTPPPETELKIGDKAPPFVLQGSDGKIHRLNEYKGKTVVLAWFPKAFTGG